MLGMVIARAERQVWTPEEIAQRWGVSLSSVYESIRRGQIPAIRCGRRLLLSKEAISKLERDGNGYHAGRDK